MSLDAVNSRVYAFQEEHADLTTKLMKGGISAGTKALNQVLAAREIAGKEGRAKENLNDFIVDIACEILQSDEPNARKEGIILLSQALSVTSDKNIREICLQLKGKEIDFHEIIDGTLFFL